ncbi:MAG: amino acid ABC transporter substrate-binding protein [Rhodospirillaceae bacterium]|nr:amino acid ABC transporter substrate-binding protein [Rhodospirillaceae bacterium]
MPMTRSTTRRSFLQAGGAAAAAVAAGALLPRRSFAADPTFKVGVVTSLSGEDVFGGNLTRRGYDFWAETINAKGGVEVGGKRYKVEMFYGDDQSSPATGADAAARLISENEVEVIMGPYTSGVTLAVAPICEKYQVPMIAGSAESPNVWKKKPQNTFGMIPSVDLTAGKSLGVILEQADPKPTSIYVVGANEPFSKEAAEGFQQGGKDLGLNELGFDLVPPNADLTPTVTTIAAKNPDIVAVGAHEEVLINFVKACKSLNFAPKALIMHYGVTNPAFAQELGKDADGVLGITVWTPDVPFKDDLFGTAPQFDEAFYNRYGSHPDYTAAACAVSGLVFQVAAGKLGKAPPLSADDRQQLTEILAATDLQTVYGPVKFAQEGDHFHDNVSPTPVLMQIQGGESKVVGPEGAKKVAMVYPLPAWSQR